MQVSAFAVIMIHTRPPLKTLCFHGGHISSKAPSFGGALLLICARGLKPRAIGNADQARGSMTAAVFTVSRSSLPVSTASSTTGG